MRERIELFSPGQRGPGTDCLYYSSWARRISTGQETRTYCATDVRHISDGHYTGWDHSAVHDGLAANLVWGANGNVSCSLDGDVLVCNNDVVHVDDGGEDKMMAFDVPPAQAARSPAPGPSVVTPLAAVVDEVGFLRRFFRDVGSVPDNIIDNFTWPSFVGYIQGHFA